MTEDRIIQLRDYAAGKASWHDLQLRGWDNYLSVLAGLGELGLRPPIANIEGPNAEAWARGVVLLRSRLLGQTPS